MGSLGVTRSGEFRRVEALPRRRWEELPELGTIVAAVNEWLRLPGATETLWPNQAYALYEIALYRGLFAPLGVSRGKAWITALAPSVVDCKRPVLLVPPELRAQTERKVLPLLRRNFKVHPNLVVAGHNEVGLEKNADFLERYRPDCLVVDECHAFADKDVKRYKKLKRYVDSQEDVVIVTTSGTMAKRSLRDFAHLTEWALGQGSPLPSSSENWREVQEWADALDLFVKPGQRINPGALERFCEPGESVLRGFQRRLAETPGVIVATGHDNIDCSMVVRVSKGPRVPDELEAVIETMRTRWENPEGVPLFEGIDVWRHLGELALGFWNKWDPPPPPDWLRARKAWGGYVTDTLHHNRRQLDSEGEIRAECEELDARGKAPIEYVEWKLIEPTYVYDVIPIWISDYAVTAAAEWLSKGSGIVWAEHVAFGAAVAERAGVRYFGEGERASSDILDASGPVVVSSNAHGEGKNLVQWDRNLFPLPLAGGKAWEQTSGRTHRFGQRSDRVTFDTWKLTEEAAARFEKARAEARWLEDAFGGRQKLNYADIVEAA